MSMTDRELADLNYRRWGVRVIGFSLIVIGSCAWMTRNDTPFLPSFLLQTLAAFLFVGLIVFSIWLGVAVGAWVGKLNGFLGFVVGFVLAIAAFFFLGILSTELPVIGPPIERVVSLIE